MEMARLVQEALTEKKRLGKQLSPIIEEFLRKFQREFKEELQAWDPDSGYEARSFIKPVESAQVRYVYSDGKPRSFTGDPESRDFKINATEGTPLVYNNEGVVYGEGSNGSLQFATTFGYGDFFSGYVEPIFVLRQNDGGIEELNGTRADLLKAYGKLTQWNAEIEVGRDSLWWGQGRHSGSSPTMPPTSTW